MTKLEKMLKYVSEHNEFYKNIIRKYGIKDPLDITQYPILTRQQLQKNRYNMFSDGYKSKYFSQQLRRQSSSGTSGMPLTVYWDYNDYSVSLAALWRLRKKYYNISPLDKVVKFTLFDGDASYSHGKKVEYYQESNTVINISRKSLNCSEKYKSLIELISDYKPKWLYIQPSILEKLMYYYGYFKINFPDSIKYIESVGEVLNDSLKAHANDFFHVPIVNMYGSEEMNGIAYECPDRSMHVLYNNVYIEIKDEAGIHKTGEGEIIITNLNNFAMPLIRYEQGDSVRITDSETLCPCENNSELIDIIHGRKQTGFFIGAQEIDSLLLTSIISEVNNKNFYMILEYNYQYIPSTNTLWCFVDIGEENRLWFDQISDQIKQCFYSHIPKDTNLKFEVVQKKVDYSAKRKILIIEED